METVTSSSSPMCNLAILETLSGNSIEEMAASWSAYCVAIEALLGGEGDLSLDPDFVTNVRGLCSIGLKSLIVEHFLCSLQETFEKNGAYRFWKHFDVYKDFASLDIEDPDQLRELQDTLHKALEEIAYEKQYQEKCLSVLVNALEMFTDTKPKEEACLFPDRKYLFSKYQLTVSSVLMASLPRHFPDVLHWYFKGRLEELSAIMASENDDSQADEEMDLDCRQGK